MASDLDRVRGQLARRNVHLTRRQILRAMGVTGLGVAALGRLLDGEADEIRVTYPALRSLLAAAPVGAEEENEKHGKPLRGSDMPAANRTQEGRFGYMFKELPPYAPPDELLKALAERMGEPNPADTTLNNLAIPAGFTFLGQFIDHDITLDRTPMPEQLADPLALTNFRSPRYDLDSVYGGGPAESPQLYEPADPARLLVVGHDLPRESGGKAILGDPRNDENLIVSQLHVVFLKFHNKLVNYVRNVLRVPAASVFESARRLARWYYQWAVVHDFLPRVIGQTLLGQILVEGKSGATANLRYYRPVDTARPMMPVEFAVAAYRFGHSMIRSKYLVNATVSPGAKDIFGPTASLTNLNGSRPLPAELVIDWSMFFKTSVTTPQFARRIDTRLSPPLLNLPTSVVGTSPMASLAERNLVRSKRLGLPSGQAAARGMGAPPLTNQQLGLAEAGWGGEAPLWFYILKEAELQPQNGERLGPVGGRIVGEVLVGLLKMDTTSYLYLSPSWKPAPPIAPASGQFMMADLVRYATAP